MKYLSLEQNHWKTCFQYFSKEPTLINRSQLTQCPPPNPVSPPLENSPALLTSSPSSPTPSVFPLSFSLFLTQFGPHAPFTNQMDFTRVDIYCQVWRERSEIYAKRSGWKILRKNAGGRSVTGTTKLTWDWWAMKLMMEHLKSALVCLSAIVRTNQAFLWAYRRTSGTKFFNVLNFISDYENDRSATVADCFHLLVFFYEEFKLDINAPLNETLLMLHRNNPNFRAPRPPDE